MTPLPPSSATEPEGACRRVRCIVDSIGRHSNCYSNRVSSLPQQSLRQSIVIAGGRGFIGGALAQHLLDAGHEVVSIDSGLFAPALNYFEIRHNPRFVDIEGDAREQSTLTSAVSGRRVSSVINCAGPARPNYCRRRPADTIANIFETTQSLIRLAQDIRAQYIHASSSEVYGNANSLPISENEDIRINLAEPARAYATAKIAVEALIFSNCVQHSLHATILRLFNVFGPHFGADDDRVIPTFVRAIEKKLDLPILGDGSQVRAYCYIDDIVRAFSASLRLTPDRCICVNIGSPVPVTVFDLAKAVSVVWGENVSVKYFPSRVGDVLRRSPDVSAARNELGWTPAISLQSGLEMLLATRTKHAGWFKSASDTLK